MFYLKALKILAWIFFYIGMMVLVMNAGLWYRGELELRWVEPLMLIFSFGFSALFWGLSKSLNKNK